MVLQISLISMVLKVILTKTNVHSTVTVVMCNLKEPQYAINLVTCKVFTLQAFFTCYMHVDEEDVLYATIL